MSTEQYAEISPTPGPLKSIFIHLAGAHPSSFRYLPEHEATDYAKVGATLLIPSLLAITAGSFTIYSLQTEKNVPFALLGGGVWAFVILLIDMAVMSQLSQTLPPPPKFPRAPPPPLSGAHPAPWESGGLRRAQPGHPPPPPA